MDFPILNICFFLKIHQIMVFSHGISPLKTLNQSTETTGHHWSMPRSRCHGGGSCGATSLGDLELENMALFNPWTKTNSGTLW